MKNSILTLLLVISFVITFNACNNSTSKSTSAESTSAKSEVYTCTMHPEVRSDEPGGCPKCGMKLVTLSSVDTTQMQQSDTMPPKQ